MSRHQQPGGGLSEEGSTRTRLKNWGQAALQASLGLVAGTAMVMFAVMAVQIGLENEPADTIRPVGPSASADPLTLVLPERAIDNPRQAPPEAPAEPVESVGAAVAQAGAELVATSPATPAPEAPATGDRGGGSLVASVDGVALKPAVPEHPSDGPGIRGNHKGESPDTDEIEEAPPSPSDDPGDRDPGSGGSGDGDEGDRNSEGSGSEDSDGAEEADEPKPAPKPEEDEPVEPDEPEESESPPPDGQGGSRDSGDGEAPGGVDGQD